jgi:hypothetical protein
MNGFAKQALLDINSKYDSLTPEDQERFRLHLTADQLLRIEQAVLKGTFGIETSDRDGFETAISGLTDGNRLTLHKAMLPIPGLGLNSFVLLEHIPEGRTLLDFPTLFDFDYDDYLRRDEAGRQPYRGEFCASWARLLLDDECYYASLSMAASHVFLVLEYFAWERLRTLLPHRQVRGKDHGKPANFYHVVPVRGIETQV